MTDLDVAVVGAGIAGLAAAEALRRAGMAVRVFEANGHVGGRMSTHRWEGYRIDEGAEMLSAHGYPATWRLIRRLGIGTDEVPRIRAAIAMWRDGRAYSGVGSPTAVFTGAGLSWRGRLALLRFTASLGGRARAFDVDQPEHTPLGLRTVAELSGGHGGELRDYLIDPIVRGMFGWSPHRSAAAPFVANMLAVRGPGAWRTYRDGMDTMARRLAGTVPVATGRAVREVVPDGNRVRVHLDGGSYTAGRVLLCVPAPLALALHPAAPEDELPYLRACSYAPMLRVSCPLSRPLAPHTRRPVHILAVPDVEDLGLAGLTIDHHRHPGRAPSGRGLVSVLASPSSVRELLDATDTEATRYLLDRAEPYLPGLRGAAVATFVHRFRYGLPEVTPAALRLRAGFLARPARPVEYAGDWVAARPSSEGAIRSAELAVARLLAAPERSVAMPSRVDRSTE